MDQGFWFRGSGQTLVPCWQMWMPSENFRWNGIDDKVRDKSVKSNFWSYRECNGGK